MIKGVLKIIIECAKGSNVRVKPSTLGTGQFQYTNYVSNGLCDVSDVVA